MGMGEVQQRQAFGQNQFGAALAGAADKPSLSMPNRSRDPRAARFKSTPGEFDAAGKANSHEYLSMFGGVKPNTPGDGHGRRQMQCQQNDEFHSALSGNVGPGTGGALRSEAEVQEFRRIKAAGGEQKVFSNFLSASAPGANHEVGVVPEEGTARSQFHQALVGERTNQPQLPAHAIRANKYAKQYGSEQQAWEFTMGGQRAKRLATPNTMNMMGGIQEPTKPVGRPRVKIDVTEGLEGYDDEEMMQGAVSYASMLGGATPTMRPNHSTDGMMGAGSSGHVTQV